MYLTNYIIKLFAKKGDLKHILLIKRETRTINTVVHPCVKFISLWQPLQRFSTLVSFRETFEQMCQIKFHNNLSPNMQTIENSHTCTHLLTHAHKCIMQQ